jgi:hypothetical protein
MVFLYASTIFFSAFLLFQVQPMIGKMILPWFGGSAAVWSTCMLFFQLVLFLGYLYAHLTTRYLSARRQSLLHLALLVLSLAWLPLAVDSRWKPGGGDDPTWLIVGLMTGAIGLPYFLLSTTGPLVQAWFAREKEGSVPYRLFALSNLGSMLGLISYPLLFEPRLTVPRMADAWSYAYLGFVVVCGLLAARGLRGAAAKPAMRSKAEPFDMRSYAWWLVLAALPAVLLMAVTSHITQNIAPIPLLWVLPLVLYLGSFILCFEGGGWYRRAWFLPLFVLAVPAMLLCAIVPTLVSAMLLLPLALYCGGLFVCCMVCHGELARLRPPASNLTAYYLMIAAGGALGGAFVALLAPQIFNDDYEMPIALLSAAIAVAVLLWREPDSTSYPWLKKVSWHTTVVFTLTLWTLLSISWTMYVDRRDIKQRNFYGVVKIKDIDAGANSYRQFTHGIVLHGLQFRAPEKRRWATTYYGEESGVGLAYEAVAAGGPVRVGVVGLGVGTMAAYCRPGDSMRFYEINPLVVHAALTSFSFLSDCQSATIAEGDARLTLEREAPQQFDLLVLDAFSGDAIPIHLLTREAFAIYFKHLKPDGVLAVHTSNLHLRLAPVVRIAADYYEKETVLVHGSGNVGKRTTASEWVLAGDRSVLTSTGLQSYGKSVGVISSQLPWTDDYSSILGILAR